MVTGSKAGIKLPSIPKLSKLLAAAGIHSDRTTFKVIYIPPVPSVRRSLLLKSRAQRLPWNFAEWFVLSQTVLPALLYLPGSQAFRVPIRMAAYGIPLAALIYWWARWRHVRPQCAPHPAAPWLVVAIAYLLLMLMHPNTNSIMSGLAQVALYLAVLSPVFWAPKLVESPDRLRRLLWLILICSGISSFVGVMQVRDPDRWMPLEFSSIVVADQYGMDSASYQGADGRTIIRPPGLSDTPGAVAGAGTFALFLGLAFIVSGRTSKKSMKAIAAVSATLGAAALFLAFVRSAFIIAVGMIAFYIFILIRQRRVLVAVALLAISTAIITGAFIYAYSLGGENLQLRFFSIVAQDPGDFYYENRGNQVSEAFFKLLPEHPFGAGLGRWGMMNAYFGDRYNRASPTIWAEIQWPAWIIDGGIVLLTLYGLALIISMIDNFKLAVKRRADGELQVMASIILAANAGLFALTFSYPVFASVAGIQFWFLTGALHGLAQRAPLSVGRRLPQPLFFETVHVPPRTTLPVGNEKEWRGHPTRTS